MKCWQDPSKPSKGQQKADRVQRNQVMVVKTLTGSKKTKKNKIPRKMCWGLGVGGRRAHLACFFLFFWNLSAFCSPWLGFFGSCQRFLESVDRHKADRRAWQCIITTNILFLEDPELAGLPQGRQSMQSRIAKVLYCLHFWKTALRQCCTVSTFQSSIACPALPALPALPAVPVG